MEQVFHKTVKIAAGAAGAIAGLFGGWDSLLKVLMAMMAADYLSGILVAVMGRSQKTEYGGLSSKVGAHGLARKGLMLLVVLVAALLDQAINAQTAVSLLENMSLAGVPFPKKIKRLLGQKLDEDEKEEQDVCQS